MTEREIQACLREIDPAEKSKRNETIRGNERTLLAYLRQFLADSAAVRYEKKHSYAEPAPGKCRMPPPPPTGGQLRTVMTDQEQELWHVLDRQIDHKPHYVLDSRGQKVKKGDRVVRDGQIHTVRYLSTVDTSRNCQFPGLPHPRADLIDYVGLEIGSCDSLEVQKVTG